MAVTLDIVRLAGISKNKLKKNKKKL